MKAQVRGLGLQYTMAELPDWAVAYIPSCEIDQWWRAVAPDLERLEQKAPSGWSPLRVQEYLLAGHIGLYVLLHRDEYSGFFILAHEKIGGGDDTHLIVWLAHTLRPGGGEAGGALVEHIARQLGHSKITFHSARDGWLRRAEAMGFKLVTRTYEKVL